ncbi:MAG: hypothetical protein RIQ43_451 [Pseudomonadota bacterium]
MMRNFGVLAAFIYLSGCASVPQTSGVQLVSDNPLETVTDEQGRNVSRYVDAARLSAIKSYVLPEINLTLPVENPDISKEQLALISNALNRSICTRLGQYLTADPDASGNAMRLEVSLTGITPTSKSIAGLSAAMDTFVPGPFRIPVGMGAIALDARASNDEGTLAFMRWAKGANPVTNSAKVSTIGDAYALIETFTREFGQLLMQGAGGPEKRQKLPDAQINVNEGMCKSRFGKVDPVGKGASFLIPLSPEFIDKGKPETVKDSEEGN